MAPGDWGETVDWLELLIDGLTFDLSGLAPGLAQARPAFRYQYDISAADLGEKYEAMRLVPGPHLATSAPSPVVLRAMLQLGCHLGRALEEAIGFGWPAARAAIGRNFLCRSIDAWLAGGPFPALGLVSYGIQPDGSMQSEGLGLLTGQEVSIAASLAQDRTAATQLAIRLVNQLVALGPMVEADVVTAPDGRLLRLDPDPKGNILRVREG